MRCSSFYLYYIAQLIYFELYINTLLSCKPSAPARSESNFLQAQAEAERLAAEAADAGFHVKSGVEAEFFILSADGDAISDVYDTAEKPCYDQQAVMRRYDVIAEICDHMLSLGWEPYQNDHEDANGQFEMNWDYDDALVTADRHAFFKYMTKAIAEKHGLRATFMPKPFANLTGNGCHAHVSLWDKAGKKNLFLDKKDELGLSKVSHHFLGGVLRHEDPVAGIEPPVDRTARVHLEVEALPVNEPQRYNFASQLLGALLADVPHSRPVPLIGTATDDALIERFELRRSQYEGPTGIVGVLHDALHTGGMATASLWAAVPGYASQVSSPKAAMALVERACSMIGTPAPLSSLAGEAAAYDAQVAAMIGDDDDMIEYLSRLEQLTDEEAADDDGDDLTSAAPLDPDGLVEEVEQFLRDRDSE